MWELHSTWLIQLLVTEVSNSVFGTAEINRASDLHQSDASSLVAHNFHIFLNVLAYYLYIQSTNRDRLSDHCSKSRRIVKKKQYAS